MKKKFNNWPVLLLSIGILHFSCSDKPVGTPVDQSVNSGNGTKNALKKHKINNNLPDKTHYIISELEEALIDSGLVNVQKIDSNIKVDLKYTSTDNFLKYDLYGNLDRAYLQPDVATKLSTAQQILSEKKPGYKLLIWDAVRPRSIQQKMWDELKHIPPEERGQYVSNPAEGSLHNYGAAVDLTILDASGNELDMATPHDYFGDLAFPSKEDQLLQAGKITKDQVQNRQLLRGIMARAGFFNIQSEWWHFNSCNRETAKQKYKLVE